MLLLLLLLLWLVMELLWRLLLLMEVMVVHLIRLLPAHFYIHILPSSSSASASTAPTPPSPLYAESPSYCHSTHLPHHPSWSVRLRHRTDAGSPSWPWRTLSFGPSGLSASLLGSFWRQECV